MVRIACLALPAFVSADPTQPHLSQAWTAKSVGDGLPGTIGDEAYYFTDKESHHLWDYGAQGLKLWSCQGSYNCIEYYVKLNSVDCCKCEDVNEPKQWDIPKSGLFTKINFNGFEDTTELNDNPVTGAEHWFTSSALPKVLTVTYDYFLHREESGDVISHRINFNTSVGQAGEILYGDFAVAHDLDAHKQKFSIPSQCKGNILNCCDQRDAIMSKWFKHDYAVEQAEKAASHYQMPPCQDGEYIRKVADGAVICSAGCEFSDAECPTDVPGGKGRAVCDTLSHECKIECSTFNKCGNGMKCYSGHCGYPSDMPVPPAPTPAPVPLPPTPPPTPVPPAPTPPAPEPGFPHYEKPPCHYSGEVEGNIQGIDGVTCLAPCDQTADVPCPQDVPEGTTATPFCAFTDPDGRAFCALRCALSSGCPTGATCEFVQFPVGVCMYPDDKFKRATQSVRFIDDVAVLTVV